MEQLGLAATMTTVNHAKEIVTAAIHALFAILDFQRGNSMDKSHQLKKITWRLKEEQYAKMPEHIPLHCTTI